MKPKKDETYINVSKEEYELNPKKCLQCGTPIYYKDRLYNKFCSKSCSAKYNGSRRTITEEQKLKTSESVRKYNKENPKMTDVHTTDGGTKSVHYTFGNISDMYYNGEISFDEVKRICPSIIHKCEYDSCGKEFVKTYYKDSHRHKSKAKYCSEECEKKAMSEHYSKDKIVDGILIKSYETRGTRSLCECKQCGRTFSQLNFRINGGGGLFCSNECRLEYMKDNKIDPNELNRLYQKKHKYGLSAEEYYKMFEDQDNKCAICERSFDEVQAFVDHDHKTGKVRGLLCTKCNTLLGMANDDPNLLRKAAKYLERNQI